MMIGQLMRNLHDNLKRMETYQYQLATGMRIVRPSQDPVGITRSLQARTELSKLDKYKQNVSDANAWLTQTEAALMEINSIITRCYELAVDAANGTKTEEDRDATSKEIAQLKEQLIEAANTTYAGRHIFGGYYTTDKPFKMGEDGKCYYYGDDNRIKYELAPGNHMDISITGDELMNFELDSTNTPTELDSNSLYGVVDELYKLLSLEEDSLDEEQVKEKFDELIGKLQKGQEHILSLLAEVGGRTKRMDLMKSRYEQDEINYKAVKSEVEDVDHEQVITEFLMAEMVYRSSLSVGARIIQPTLVDFLR